MIHFIFAFPNCDEDVNYLVVFKYCGFIYFCGWTETEMLVDIWFRVFDIFTNEISCYLCISLCT